MKALLTKRFSFSASFSRDGRVYGHNYTLGVTLPFSDKIDEEGLERSVREGLIDKIHSRDLSLHVDILKNVEITDLNLLRAFAPEVAAAVRPLALHSLWLERDSRTRLEIHVGA